MYRRSEVLQALPLRLSTVQRPFLAHHRSATLPTGGMLTSCPVEKVELPAEFFQKSARLRLARFLYLAPLH